MKIIFRTAVIAVILVTAACGKETATAIADIFDEEIEQIENTVLDAEKVSDNVIIAGGTKMEGTPPSPNGAISLDLSDSGKIAFLDEGFDVSLSSDTELTGAYIQFKSKDGSVSDSYYDVDLQTNNSDEGSKFLGRRRVKKSSRSLVANKIDETLLDVDFNTNIEPGEFCYEICVYDAQGNISEPQEVCVTVESWGGLAAAVGNWNMIKEEKTLEDGTVATYLLGEQSCDTVEEFTCNDGGSFESSRNCLTINHENLSINADGTYTYKYDEDYKYLNSTQSKVNCESIFEDDSYILNSYGKWAYVSEDEILVFIERSYETLAYDGSGELETEIHEVGDGEALFDQDVEFTGDSFIATQGEYRIFFEK